MAFSKDFWSQDRTTINEKTNWFSILKPKRKILFVLLVLFTCAWFFYLGMTASFAVTPEWDGYLLTGRDWRDTLPEGDDPIALAELEGMDVVLLVGADKRPGEQKYRTDTIILAFFDWDTQDLKLLSIPRDSYVQIPGTNSKGRINGAYFSGGQTLLRNTIEYTLGIVVDKYVELDFNGFEKIIEAIGGVRIDVDRRMYKPSEGINIQPGLQTLNGHDALGFVRFRDLLQGDIDRIANQQKFIQALAQQLKQSFTITKAPQLVNIVLDNSQTDYAITEAVGIVSSLFKTDIDNIAMYSVPGVAKYINGASYWIIDTAAYEEMIKEIAGGKLDEVHDFHIIDDGGRGTYSPPHNTQPEEDETPEEDEGTEPGAEGEAGTTDPNAADPNAADPNVTDPNTADPGVTDPTTTDPATPDPGASDPGTTDPGTTDPGGTDDPPAQEPTQPDPPPGTDDGGGEILL